MVHKSKVELRTDTVCMRENPFMWTLCETSETGDTSTNV